MRRRTCLLLFLSLTLAACTSLVGAQRPTAEIAIATDFPTSAGMFGSGSNGLALQHAAALAVRQHPLIRGFRVELLPFDYAAGLYPEAKASQVAQQLVETPRILGVVGPANSYIAALQMPILNTADLAMVAPSTTADCLTLATTCSAFSDSLLRPSGRNNFFRLSAPDSSQGRAMADFAVHTLGVRRVAVLNGPSPYARGVAAAFDAGLADDGGTLVAQEEFDPSVVTFIPWLSRARDAGAEAIYAAGSADSRICAAREQAKQVFTNDVYFLGPDGIVTQTCLDQAQDNLGNRMYGTVASGGTEMRSAGAVQLTAQLRKAYPADHQPQPYAMTTYDATMLLINAIGRAIDASDGKVPTRPAVVEALSVTPAFEGVVGTYSFTPAGDNSKAEIALYQVQGRAWAFLKPVPVGARISS